MSEPTIQDVVELIQQLRAEMATKGELQALHSKVDKLEAKVDAHHAETATKEGLRTLEAKVDAHRAETAKGFAELDRELSGHADPIHRKLEEEISSIKKQLATRPAVRRLGRRA